MLRKFFDWVRSFFIDKELPRDKQLELIFERSEKFEIMEFTPSGIATILEVVRTRNTALFVCAKDATIIQADNEFAGFFDPVNQIVRLDRGNIGSIWALPVISDLRFQKRFLNNSFVVNLSHADFETVYD